MNPKRVHKTKPRHKRGPSLKANFSPSFFSFGAGIGGEVHGLQRAAWFCVGTQDACPANNRVLNRRFPHATHLASCIYKKGEREKLPKSVDLVSVSFPCQPLSSNNKRKFSQDPRLDVGCKMLELAFEMNPKLIIMENVQGLLKSPLLGTLTARLKACGYAVSVYLLNGDRFTATSRPRVFILGSQIGEDLLHGLASRMRKLPRLRIKDQFECTSLWHPVRPSGHGPNGQHCIIPASSTYPCIDTKCLLRPPPNYRGHPPDHGDGLGGTSYPSARTILELLGFPRDYLATGEIEQPNCRCNICNGHRSSQAAQMLGRSWGPHMAMEIGHALLGPLTRAKLQEQNPRSRVHSLKASIHGEASPAPSDLEQLDYAAAQMRATPVLRGTEAAWFNHVRNIYNFRALRMYRKPDCKQRKVMLRQPPRYPITGPPARACISESVLGSYVSQEEDRSQCDLRDYVALEKYSMDDVIRGKHTSKISHKSIDALHKT